MSEKSHAYYLANRDRIKRYSLDWIKAHPGAQRRYKETPHAKRLSAAAGRRQVEKLGMAYLRNLAKKAGQEPTPEVLESIRQRLQVKRSAHLFRNLNALHEIASIAKRSRPVHHPG